MSKLRRIAGQLNVSVEDEALRLLAQRAEGGLRDAESLFDQILAFEEGPMTILSVTAILGLMPRDIYFEIDQAGKEGRFVKAFEIAHRVFSEGKRPSPTLSKGWWTTCVNSPPQGGRPRFPSSFPVRGRKKKNMGNLPASIPRSSV